MKKKIFLLILVSVLLNSSLIFAATGRYSDENFSIDVKYNNEIVPGDAVFVRMTVSAPKNHKKAKTENERKAVLQLYNGKKLIESSPFYLLPKKKTVSTNGTEYLSGIPISPWTTEGDFTLKIAFQFNENNKTQEFNLPVVFKNRDFDYEDIELDSKNTDIKTDNSPERAAQIEKLNNILFTTLITDIYSTKRFNAPTNSTRYTAHFGDRRKYIYVNGKTNTNLHYGNDYGVPEGTQVFSCGEGRVVMAESRISTGWSIVIEHLPGLYSLYYHLSEMNVKEGDYVKQGDLIGKSGSTGLATGPHLHWEIRLNGSAVRPEFFIQDFAFEDQ